MNRPENPCYIFVSRQIAIHRNRVAKLFTKIDKAGNLAE